MAQLVKMLKASVGLRAPAAPCAKDAPPAPSGEDGALGAVQSWTGDDIAVEIQSRNLAAAYRAWMAVTSKRLPRLSDLTGSEARPALDDMLLLSKVEDDFLVVAQSESYVRNVGRDLRGLLLSEFTVPIAATMREVSREVIASARPAYVRYVSELSQQSIYWEVLLVPLAAADGGPPSLVLNFVSLIDDKSAVMQMVFDRSPVGMIIAAPTRSESGDVDNGHILGINASARRLLRLTESNRQIQTIRQLGPWFRDGTAWTRTGESNESGRSQIFYRDNAMKNFAVTIEPFSRFLLFSIVENRAPGRAGGP